MEARGGARRTGLPVRVRPRHHPAQGAPGGGGPALPGGLPTGGAGRPRGARHGAGAVLARRRVGTVTRGRATAAVALALLFAACRSGRKETWPEASVVLVSIHTL